MLAGPGTSASGPARAGSRFEAWQYNSGPAVARVFTMRIDVAGVLPMFGADTYIAGRGSMRGKVLGLVPVADGSGPEFDLGELVTWLDDAVLLAPSMLLVPAVTWVAVDDDSFDVVLTDHGTTVTGRVSVDELGRVRDFSTADRYCALPSGLVRARWTTPVEGWTMAGGRPVPLGGPAIWDLPDGPYEYARGRVDPGSVEWNVPPTSRTRERPPAVVRSARHRHRTGRSAGAGATGPDGPASRWAAVVGGREEIRTRARRRPGRRLVGDGRSGPSTARDRCAGASGDGHPR